jgi:hypothetical protein
VSRRRTLLSLRRPVAPERRAAYDAAWARLHAAATARGAHAWRFRSAADEERALEFLEFAAEADVRAHPEVRAALDALEESSAPAVVEEWIESPLPEPRP